MSKHNLNLHRSLVSKLILTVGLTLLLSIFGWAYLNISHQKERAMSYIVNEADRLTNTIQLGTHYAMMLNSRDDINEIIINIGKLDEIETIRLYNKEGQIKFSNNPGEVDQRTNIKAEACDICHRTEPPMPRIALDGRIRMLDSREGSGLLGIISPIYNEPGCSTGDCHVHPADKTVLGALDVVVSLKDTEAEIRGARKSLTQLAFFVFLLSSSLIFIFVLKFVNHPIKRLIAGTRLIAKGDYSQRVDGFTDDEMGQLAAAINQMAEEVGASQAQLNRQRNEYQTLFEGAPCIITVQDRDFKLLRYNREFADKFKPEVGDYCYHAYKGRNEKCVECPVEKTFRNGLPYTSEETGVDRDGVRKQWLVKTSPLKNERGEVIAAMEMNLDITNRKDLEERLNRSERKYRAIFNNIPIPVFVLDRDSLAVLDCNHAVSAVYGYEREEIVGREFLDLFGEEEKEKYASRLKTSAVIDQAKHVRKDGQTIFVSIRISPSEYQERDVFLVMTSDITKRLQAEQQLIQASKMATLGEMATGVAHELNQPLSVIKTASSFFMKKIRKEEKIKDEILFEMSSEIDSHVDRATKIINHMRQFGRKPEMTAEKIQAAHVMKRAFDFFSQQLKVRGIEVVWDASEELPMIMADPGKLEQVFINLLINARDAIEERWESRRYKSGDKRITIKTMAVGYILSIEVHDTGAGIPEAVIHKIFEPFFTTKKVGKGTGLGLSISYGIIKDYGGDIEARSKNGEGACFTITFPIPDEGEGT